MDRKPKNRPTAASEKATGKPISRNSTSPPNISGGMTSTFSMAPPPASLFGPVVLDHHLGRHLVAVQQGDPLDQLRQALEGEQSEADRHQDLHRPAQEAAGVGRAFVADEAVHEEGP